MSNDESINESFLLPCPECGKPTDSLKCYRTLIAVFLFVFIWWQKKNTIACPKCMRGKLLEFAGINLFTMHVGWPIVILPMTILYWMGLSARGHSMQILEEVASGRYGDDIAETAARILERQKADWERPVMTRFVRRRLFGVFKIVLGLAAIVITPLVVANEWYYMPHSYRSMWLMGSAAIGGFAAALIWSGIANWRQQRISWRRWLTILVVGGILFGVGIQPAVTTTIWNKAEREAAAKKFGGYDDLPPELWKPEPLRAEVNRLRMSLHTYQRAEYDLQEIYDGIQQYHANDPRFTDILALIRRSIKVKNRGDDNLKFDMGVPELDPHPSEGSFEPSAAGSLDGRSKSQRDETRDGETDGKADF